ncbi:MAG: hypothetical protein KAR06_03135 [Deltaproteobacteria bacterium]|nr:hypothetical protein [Deltaproteobacteria bacterium]
MAKKKNDNGLVKRILKKLLGTSEEGLGAATEKVKKRKKKLKEVAKETE